MPLDSTTLIYTLLFGGIAGLAAFLGSVIAAIDHAKMHAIHDDVVAGIMAFGGGALLAAVGLVLVPDGMEIQPLWLATVSFLFGGLVFLWIDRMLSRRGSPVTQLLALMLDFVPEAVVLGAVISSNFKQAVFLCVIIAAQNLPEGFNAYREMRHSQAKLLRQHVLGLMAIAALVGPVAAVGGLLLFRPDSTVLGTLMTFCAGGIVYLVFRDIAPDAKSENSWYASLGAVVGFTVGLIGSGLTAH